MAHIFIRKPIEERLTLCSAIGDIVGENEAIFGKQLVGDEQLKLIEVLVLLGIEEDHVVRGFQFRYGRRGITYPNFDRSSAEDHPVLC